jgi:linear primary-alkylsulfatase
LKSTLVQFDIGFEMMPGTGSADLSPERGAFEQAPPAETSGG